MSAALHLAGADDIDRLLPLIAAYHAIENITQTEETRLAATMPLLHGSPHGAIWLIGPRRAPVGYIAICFGWSIEMGGLDGFVDEFFIRKSVRGRGMGGEILNALTRHLAETGLKALHLEVARENIRARKFYEKQRFIARDRYSLMTWLADRPQTS